MANVYPHRHRFTFVSGEVRPWRPSGPASGGIPVTVTGWAPWDGSGIQPHMQADHRTAGAGTDLDEIAELVHEP
jgi:hypothetical protein